MTQLRFRQEKQSNKFSVTGRVVQGDRVIQCCGAYQGNKKSVMPNLFWHLCHMLNKINLKPTLVMLSLVNTAYL